MKTHSTFGPLSILIVILTVSIALIHMSLLFPNTLFLLNGVGYLGLLALLYLPIAMLGRFRRYIRWLLIAYTAATVVFWISWGARSTLGYLTVGAEVLLIVLLAYEGYQIYWIKRGDDVPKMENGSGQIGADA